MLIPLYVLDVLKRSRNMCAMTGLNIQSFAFFGDGVRITTGENIPPLAPWGEGVRRTGEGLVGSQSNVQHNTNSPKRTYSPIHLLTYSLFKKCAFTLAEILITLGIIGVVAALTMPALIANHKAVTLKSGLNTAYSLIGQAIERMRADGIELSAGAFSANTFKDEFIKYFEIITDCGSVMTPHKNNFPCAGVSSPSNIYKNFSKKTAISMDYLNDGQFILKNGVQIFIEDPAVSLKSRRIYITVDINGSGKRPNAWGQDLFTFQILDNGKLLPMGAEGTKFYDENDTYCSKESSENINGIGCTAKALSEPDYFKKLP